jgi:hypothetical protein
MEKKSSQLTDFVFLVCKIKLAAQPALLLSTGKQKALLTPYAIISQISPVNL